jgi:hypothetical protein
MSDADRDLVNLMIEEIQNRKNMELIDKVFSVTRPCAVFLMTAAEFVSCFR